MSVSFCTPLIFQYPKDSVRPLREKFLNRVEQYFSLKKQKGFLVLPPLDPLTPSQRKVVSILIPSSSTLLTTIKIFSYLTVIIPLLMLLAKFILRIPYTFSKSSLKPSLDHLKMPFTTQTKEFRNPHILNTHEIVTILKELSPFINAGTPHNDIEYIKSSDYYQHFKLLSYPGIIFKTYLHNKLFPESFQNAYNETLKKCASTDKMIAFIKTHACEHLYIPIYKSFEISLSYGKQIFIAEEALPLYSSEDTATVWKIHDTDLRPAFTELAHLIEKTGLLRSTPDICTPFYHNDRWTLVLLDTTAIPHLSISIALEEFSHHLYSAESISAVIDVVSEKYKPFLIKIMKEHTLKQAILSSHEKFHEDNSSSPYAPTEPLDIETTFFSTKLPMIEKGTTKIPVSFPDKTNKSNTSKCYKHITMQYAFQHMLYQINAAITVQPTFTINSHCLIVHTDLIEKTRSKNGYLKLSNPLWMHRILSSLVTKGYIHSWEILKKKHDSHSISFRIWI